MLPRLFLILFCLPSWVLPQGVSYCLCTGSLTVLESSVVRATCSCTQVKKKACCKKHKKTPLSVETKKPCENCCVAVLSVSADSDRISAPDAGSLLLNAHAVDCALCCLHLLPRPTTESVRIVRGVPGEVRPPPIAAPLSLRI
jgi:hypothetical protein